jgi:exodeoxyribonuclease-3
MERLLNSGYVDAFRRFEPGAGHYTWWSYRPGVREKNIGWRLDYHVVNQEGADRLKSVLIEAEVKGSDHCPVRLDLKR